MFSVILFVAFPVCISQALVNQLVLNKNISERKLFHLPVSTIPSVSFVRAASRFTGLSLLENCKFAPCTAYGVLS